MRWSAGQSAGSPPGHLADSVRSRANHRPLDPRKVNVTVDANAFDQEPELVARLCSLRDAQQITIFVPGGVRSEAQHPRTPEAVQSSWSAISGFEKTTHTIIPAVEVLVNTSGVAKIIESNKFEQLNAAIELGSGDGMQTFTQALLDLLKGGKITQAEALAHAPNADTMKMRLQGVILTDNRRIISAR